MLDTALQQQRGSVLSRKQSTRCYLADRYFLLISSLFAFLGYVLSLQPYPALSFLGRCLPLSYAIFYALLSWLFVCLVTLIAKLRWGSQFYDRTWKCYPLLQKSLQLCALIFIVLALVVVIDRWFMYFVRALQIATTASQRPTDHELASVLYLAWAGRSIFVTGILTTIYLAVFGTSIAFVLAILLAFCRLQVSERGDNDALRFLKSLGVGFARLYSTVVRGTPMIVQAGIIYFGGFALVRLTGLPTNEITAIWSTFVAGLVTITLNSTAYMMEVLRGGIEAVDKGQLEAARSLGLSQWEAMLSVVVPQGIKHAIPALSNELVINIKDSSVLSVIGVFDLMFATTTIAGTYYQQTQSYLIAAALYLCLTMFASWLLKKFARRFDVDAQVMLGTSDMLTKLDDSATAERGAAHDAE